MSVRIDMPKATPAGVYKLAYFFVVKEGNEEVNKSASITVTVEK